MTCRTVKILLLLVLIFASACRSSDILFKKLYPRDDLVIIYHSTWGHHHYKTRIKTFMNTPLKKGDIVFLGDSITEQGGDWSAKFGVPNVRNRGIAGDVTDGVIARLDEICHAKAKAVFLMIGINDIFNWYDLRGIPSPEYVGNNILKIVKEIHKGSPKTKIYVQTVLPADFMPVKEAIATVNDIIRSHEAKYRYKVIDLHTDFAADDDLIKPELTSDGIHLSAEGYALWVKLLEETITGD